MSSLLFGYLAGKPTNPNPGDVLVPSTSLKALNETIMADSGNTKKAKEEAEKVSKDTKTPEKNPLQQVLENLAGLVPLEALLVWGYVYQKLVDVDNSEKLVASIRVKDASSFTGAFLAFMGLSVVLSGLSYVAGGNKTGLSPRKYAAKGVAVGVIPGIAFFLWQYLPDPSGLRQAHGWQTNGWYFACFAVAVALVAASVLLGVRPRTSTGDPAA